MSQRSEQVSLFAAFFAAGVEYAVVGDVAVNAHGFVRNTRDLDLFLRPTEQNAQAALRALAALGAPLEDIWPTPNGLRSSPTAQSCDSRLPQEMTPGKKPNE